MGCDIHMFLEKWSDEDFEGPKNISEERNIKLESVLEGTKTKRWISADEWEFSNELGEESYWSVPYGKSFYYNRSYYMFSILADVRNYRGDVIPICEPRGIPEDASDGYKCIVKQWDGDGHSHSYFTLRELMNVNWSVYKEEWIGDFIDAIEKMKLIDPDPDNVRACFFFDN